MDRKRATELVTRFLDLVEQAATLRRQASELVFQLPGEAAEALRRAHVLDDEIAELEGQIFVPMV